MTFKSLKWWWMTGCCTCSISLQSTQPFRVQEVHAGVHTPPESQCCVWVHRKLRKVHSFWHPLTVSVVSLLNSPKILHTVELARVLIAGFIYARRTQHHTLFFSLRLLFRRRWCREPGTYWAWSPNVAATFDVGPKFSNFTHLCVFSRCSSFCILCVILCGPVQLERMDLYAHLPLNMLEYYVMFVSGWSSSYCGLPLGFLWNLFG